MNRILITGGAGFIGSHVADRVASEFPDAQIVILDKMTYAADMENVLHLLVRGQRSLVVGDLCDAALCVKLTRDVDCIIHLAAESHVDNSFGNSIHFSESNVLGTHTLLEACRQNKVSKIIHVSTDEVYGEIESGWHFEPDVLNPTNPYSASKAAAEMIVRGYRMSFRMPIITVRANNIFGARQFPEKIIPRFTMQAMLGRRFTIHGNGLNRRHYLAAEDFADAIIRLINKGVDGETYNIGSEEEYTNIEVRNMIAAHFDIDADDNTELIPDRPFNDCRYAVNCDKIRALGWRPERRLEKRIGEVIQWYKDNSYRYLHLFPENN
ncbi:MAG: GDP-mannose 4,6-dehydratase [Stagnimonas sp.]|nr:GDP-mannose 4,6-dehydratase [Stagnimonas sp.]